MDMPMEVIFTSDTSDGHSNCSVWNFEGGLITAYKGGNINPKTLALVRDDFLLGAVTGTPKLKCWTLGAIGRSDSKFILPGEVLALAVTPCGTFCVAAIAHKLYIWKVSSGELLATANGHFQSITCLKFSDDGSRLVSGGKDAVVNMWSLHELVQENMMDDVKPHCSWSHHAGEVTDIFIGSLISDRLATVSKDETCKIYDMSIGQLLLSINMDVELTSVTMDPGEYFVVMGAANGEINKVNLFNIGDRTVNRSKLGGGTDSFIGHTASVTCVSISMEGTILVSGSDDKFCMIWNIASCTRLRTISHAGAITNAFITMAPYAVIANVKVEPKLPISPFSRSLVKSYGTDIFTKFEPLRLEGCATDTSCVDNDNKDFIRKVTLGMKEPGIVNKECMQKNLEKSAIINEQIYSFSLSTIVRKLEKEEKET